MSRIVTLPWPVVTVAEPARAQDGDISLTRVNRDGPIDSRDRHAALTGDHGDRDRVGHVHHVVAGAEIDEMKCAGGGNRKRVTDHALNIGGPREATRAGVLDHRFAAAGVLDRDRPVVQMNINRTQRLEKLR